MAKIEWNEERPVPESVKIASAPSEKPHRPNAPIMSIVIDEHHFDAPIKEPTILVFNAERVLIDGGAYILRSAAVCTDPATGERQLQLAVTPEVASGVPAVP